MESVTDSVSSQAEWDKYFPIEQNTGDLNIPDFNFADFTGDLNGPAMNPISFNGAGIAVNIPPANDLADVNFTPTYFTTQGVYNQ